MLGHLSNQSVGTDLNKFLLRNQIRVSSLRSIRNNSKRNSSQISKILDSNRSSSRNKTRIRRLGNRINLTFSLSSKFHVLRAIKHRLLQHRLIPNSCSSQYSDLSWLSQCLRCQCSKIMALSTLVIRRARLPCLSATQSMELNRNDLTQKSHTRTPVCYLYALSMSWINKR